MSARSQILFWFFGFLVFAGFVWMLKDVLTPFIIGFVVAYLLNPLVVFLEKHKCRRWVASLIILLAFVITVFVVMTLVLPIAYKQMVFFVEAVPGYFESIAGMLSPYYAHVEDWLSDKTAQDTSELLSNHLTKALAVSGGVFSNIAMGGQAILGFIGLVFITPLIAFLMMNEWPSVMKYIQGLYPQAHKKTISGLIRRIDQKVSGFIRGQMLVALILAVIYASVLSICGLNYGFLIGIAAGFLSIIPLVGSIAGLLISVIVAWFQDYNIEYTGLIACVFIIGQVIEGNFLTPKLVGDSVGLHPLWILFSLMVGGSLLGILGMLIAVPVVASLGVLIGHGVDTYKASSLYKK